MICTHIFKSSRIIIYSNFKEKSSSETLQNLPLFSKNKIMALALVFLKFFFFCRTYFRFTDPISGSIYVGECDSKRRKYGYGHCRFENGDLYHGLWKKDQMDEFGCYWWSNTGIVMCRISDSRVLGRFLNFVFFRIQDSLNLSLPFINIKCMGYFMVKRQIFLVLTNDVRKQSLTS